MHVSGHIKPFTHEAHGSKSIADARKKPPNREEVGAVKDHFSEGRQQESQRPPIKSARVEEAEAPFETPEFDEREASPSIGALLKEAAPNAEEPAAAAQVKSKDVLAEPSLEDLLSLMRAKP